MPRDESRRGKRSPDRERERGRYEERDRYERDRDRDRELDRYDRTRDRDRKERRRSRSPHGGGGGAGPSRRSPSPRRYQRYRSPSPIPEPAEPKSTSGKTQDIPEIVDESQLTEEDKMMRQVLGFCQFDTTQGKHIPGNEEGVVHVVYKRKYRQYMNRRGGFNRPLDYVA